MQTATGVLGVLGVAAQDRFERAEGPSGHGR